MNLTEDEVLERMETLDWLDSDYAENSEWVPSAMVPDDVAQYLRNHGPIRRANDGFSYYITKSGNLTRYTNE